MFFETSAAKSTFEPSEIVACIDFSAHSDNVAEVAKGLAQTLDLPLTLLHVIEPSAELGRRPDPLEWDLRRHQARRQLARLSDGLNCAADSVRLEVKEGGCVRAICERGENPGALLVMGTRADASSHPRSCGQTAQYVVECGVAPVLLVPAGQALAEVSFERVLVPLDGSSFGEAALTEAARLARKTQAEMVLLHVIPDAGLTQIGPPETSDLELRLRLDQRNEKAACGFLERTHRRLTDQGLAVRHRCLKGDTRSTLLRAINEEQPGLVILSSRGQGGRRCQDLSLGSTAAYLLAHLNGPMLLVRPTNSTVERPALQEMALRMPTSAFAA